MAPFAEQLGILERLNNSGRIHVLLNIMGGTIRVHVPRDYAIAACPLVGRFHGSNDMPTKIGPSGCSCKMPVNEEAMMAADMIGFMNRLSSQLPGPGLVQRPTT